MSMYTELFEPFVETSNLLSKLRNIKNLYDHDKIMFIQVISDVTKPVVLKNVLSKILSLNVNKIELFCNCWTANAEQVVSRLQQNFTQFYRVITIIFATECFFSNNKFNLM